MFGISSQCEYMLGGHVANFNSVHIATHIAHKCLVNVHRVVAGSDRQEPLPQLKAPNRDRGFSSVSMQNMLNTTLTCLKRKSCPGCS